VKVVVDKVKVVVDKVVVEVKVVVDKVCVEKEKVDWDWVKVSEWVWLVCEYVDGLDKVVVGFNGLLKMYDENVISVGFDFSFLLLCVSLM